jgi:cytochrome c-type biogenesis protein CcmH/NrfF
LDDRHFTVIPSLKKRGPEPEYFVCKFHHVRMVKVNDILRCPQCGNTRIKEEEDTPKFIEGAI